jgi:hypothetical protein
MALTSFTPNQNFARFSTLVYPSSTVTTYPSDATITVAELLGGFFVDTEAGASTFTLPTATAINAAVPAPAVGMFFDFYLRNTGNNTATVAVGTGITSATGNTLTVATVNTRQFRLLCTGVRNQGAGTGTDSYTLYSLGVSAH